MDRERARVADVREVREELERLDELPALIAAALDAERQDAADAASARWKAGKPLSPIDGMPIGSSAGAGIALADGKFASELKLVPLLVTAAHIIAIPIGTGLADVRAWKKDHPFPNIFAPPHKP